MSFNIGINVIEVQGRVTPALVAAPTSRAGFIIRSKRGIDDGRVVEVSSWKSFVEHFGGHVDGAFGAYALQGFFQNGGSIAHVTRVLPSGGGGGTRASAASRTFSPSGGTATVLTVTAGRRDEVDPGKWGDEIAIKLTSTTPGFVDLIVRYPGTSGRDVETWDNLDFGSSASRAAAQERINRASGYIKVAIADAETVGEPPAATSAPGHDDFVLLGVAGVPGSTPGSDGSFAAGADIDAYASAVDRFDGEPIQLLCCPETHDPEVVTKGLGHCADQGDRLYVGHLEKTPVAPDDTALGAAVPTSFRGDKVFGALYAPWVAVPDPLAIVPKFVPPVGHVLGVYERVARERGVWKAPAGDGTRLEGVLDAEWKVSDTVHTKFVKRFGVNLVRPILGKGIVVDSARTLSTNPLWYYVNVRRLFNFVKSTLKDGLRWAVHEPNDERLWERVRLESVRPFLMSLWRQGAFGPGSPDDVFTIQVDGGNNPPSNIQLGLLNVDITFFPSRPAETIVIRVGQQLGASSADES